jgi:hypothetical protein
MSTRQSVNHNNHHILFNTIYTVSNT